VTSVAGVGVSAGEVGVTAGADVAVGATGVAVGVGEGDDEAQATPSDKVISKLANLQIIP
jgi:hypothetical protein